MRRCKGFVVGCCLFVLSFSGGIVIASPVRDTVRVLFVGNSYTYYNNLIQMVSLISDSLETKLICTKSTVGGTNLGEHWNEQKGLQSRTLIEKGHYNIVVLQDHSMRPIEAPDSLVYFGSLFCDLIKKRGARPFIYNTWSREKTPSTQKQINEGYKELASKCSAARVPVGDCWQKVLERLPNASLYISDGSHPSNLGTFIAALCFVKAITGKLPSSLPSVFNYYDKDGETFRIMQVGKEEMALCMDVVNGIINQAL
ncbi:MAG: hypothetical protein RLZ05_1120 [Bacteroidota bacterium]|jgi:hypothetical protein